MAEAERKYTEQNPATVHDVVAEFTEVARVTALIEVSSGADQDRYRQQQAIQQAYLALALESWMGEGMQYVASTVVAGLSDPLTDRLAEMHVSLHEQ